MCNIKKSAMSLLYAMCVVCTIMFSVMFVLEISLPTVYVNQIHPYGGTFFKWTLMFWSTRAAILLFR